VTGADERPAYRVLVEALLADPHVSEAQTMGMASLKVGVKLFGGAAGEGGCLEARARTSPRAHRRRPGLAVRPVRT
jgi:hypothetical protein